MYGRDLAYIHHHGFSGFARATAPQVLAILRASHLTSGLIVDLGCGSGVLAAALLDAGYDVVGVDVSADMIELARREAPRATFVCASLHDVHLPPCTAITAIGEPFAHVTPLLLRETFARCARALPSGGLLLFDVIEDLPDGTMPDRHWSAEGDDWIVAADLTKNGREITRSMWMALREGDREESPVRRTTEVHQAWSSTREELVDDLAAAGFTASFGGWELPAGRLAVQARRL